MQRIVVGISGASGAIYGIRLLEVLSQVPVVETHLVATPSAWLTVKLETEFSRSDIESLADFVHQPGNIAAPIASGSFLTRAMIVAPCSMKTLSGIASSYSSNLLLRAADVALKDRRPLVLLPRETPLHQGHLRLMRQVTEMGAIVAPPTPAFYHRPATVEEIVDQTVGRSLDLLGIELEQDLFPRWAGATGPVDKSV